MPLGIYMPGWLANPLPGCPQGSPASKVLAYLGISHLLLSEAHPLPASSCRRPRFVIAKDGSYNQRDCVKFSATLVRLLPRR